MLTLTLTRTSLSLPDLVIGSDPFAGAFHIPEDGMEWPRFDTRRVFAPESEVMAGRTLLSARRETSPAGKTRGSEGSMTHGASEKTLVRDWDLFCVRTAADHGLAGCHDPPRHHLSPTPATAVRLAPSGTAA